MIARLHRFADSLGISPKVLDQFIAAVALILFNWLAVGEPLDVEGLKLAAGLFVLAAIGVAAPPAHKVNQKAISRMGARH